MTEYYQKPKWYLHKLFKKHLQNVKFYPRADNFTHALHVMHVTNIMSGRHPPWSVFLYFCLLSFAVKVIQIHIQIQRKYRKYRPDAALKVDVIAFLDLWAIQRGAETQHRFWSVWAEAALLFNVWQFKSKSIFIPNSCLQSGNFPPTAEGHVFQKCSNWHRIAKDMTLQWKIVWIRYSLVLHGVIALALSSQIRFGSFIHSFSTFTNLMISQKTLCSAITS